MEVREPLSQTFATSSPRHPFPAEIKYLSLQALTLLRPEPLYAKLLDDIIKIVLVDPEIVVAGDRFWQVWMITQIKIEAVLGLGRHE